MPKYLNPNAYDLHLAGPDGVKITIKRGRTVRLSDWFQKYADKGILKLEPGNDVASRRTPNKTQRLVLNRSKAQRNLALRRAKTRVKRRTGVRPVRSNSPDRVVGRVSQQQAISSFHELLQSSVYPVSNDVGVGIMSCNRVASLRRLIDSIIRFTDLHRTTVFISDDASTDATSAYLDELERSNQFVVLRNATNLGVAGNSNRLLRCLSRFKYKLLLNDDVEVLGRGWDIAYFNYMERAQIHHIIHHEPGVYGAKPAQAIRIRDVDLQHVSDRPHGAIMAFDDVAFEKVGFFDEQFGKYGCEHVDWSERVARAGLQLHPFISTPDSNQYFKIYADQSVIPERVQLLKTARKIYAALPPDRVYVAATSASEVPRISFVIPFRSASGRDGTIDVAIENIKAMRYPDVEIITTEHADRPRPKQAFTSKHIFTRALPNQEFNKSMAFNAGVDKITSNVVCLHDADTLASGNYAQDVADALRSFESCHLGWRVYYADIGSTERIVNGGLVDANIICDRFVKYFEGGSIACHTDVFWRSGAFLEDFWGYGCFLPGNFVTTDRGLVPIEEVVKADKLLTHSGEYRKQEAKIRDYSGPVYDIFVPGRLPIKGVTPEHPFLVQDATGEYGWKHTIDLAPGDLLAQTDVFPDLSPAVRYETLLSEDKSPNHFDITNCRNDICYLLGMYLAEGVIQSPRKLSTTSFFLHEDEEFLAERIAQSVSRLNLNINVNSEYVKNTCRHVVVCNSRLAKMIYATCGKHKAPDKIISVDYLNELPDEAISHVLGGMVDGDGGHQHNSEKRIVYHTSSINLAYLVSSMMRRLSIAHSFGKRKGGSFKNSRKWVYDLTVNREFEHLISSIYPRPPYLGSSSVGRSQFGLIYDIGQRYYSGPVYNFEVQEDRSYYVHGICVHNCEDCEFYHRLSRVSDWTEDRKHSFLHLDHPRTHGWHEAHDRNKRLHEKIKAKGIEEFLQERIEWIKKSPYASHI